MMKVLFLIGLFALTVFGDVTECEDCNHFPMPCLKANVDDDHFTTLSYFDAKIQYGGRLDIGGIPDPNAPNSGERLYSGYCLEPSRFIKPDREYGWVAISSLDPKFVNTMTNTWGLGDLHFENFDNVNYLFSHLDDLATTYTELAGITWGDVQRAIWWLIHEDGFSDYRTTAPYNDARVEFLVQLAIDNNGFDPIYADECYGVVLLPTARWPECGNETVAQTQLIRVCFDDFMACSDENGHELSDECSGNGYCVKGETNQIYACSCSSGYTGRTCETEVPGLASCELPEIDPTSSVFVTTIDGNIDDCGNVRIRIKTPFEVRETEELDTAVSQATRIHFEDQDSCDYPESTRNIWSDVSDPQECFQTYESCTSFLDLLDCTGENDPFCRDADGVQLQSCDPASCEEPPCEKCFPAQVQTIREYQKTSESGLFSTKTTAENCHYFQICLPWIQKVEDPIYSFTRSDLQENILLSRVGFSCFEEEVADDCEKEQSWSIEILSSISWPLHVTEVSENSGELTARDGSGSFDLVSITEVSGCFDEGSAGTPCVQLLKYRIPECSALSERKVYDLTGLEYSCYEGNCGVLSDFINENPELLATNASVEIQGTQDNCGAEFTIDGTDTITLDMDSFEEDYSAGNNVYLYVNDSSSAFLKVTALSTVAVDELVIEALYRSVEGAAFEEVSFTARDCTDGSEIAKRDETEYSVCFSSAFAGIPELGPDSGISSIVYKASVRIVYVGESSVAKRSVGLNSDYEVSTATSVVDRRSTDNEEPQQESSGAFVAISAAGLVLAAL